MSKSLKVKQNYKSIVSFNILVLSCFFTLPLQAANLSLGDFFDYKSSNVDKNEPDSKFWQTIEKNSLQKILMNEAVNEAENLARQGAIQLDKGEREFGLEKLYKSWALNKTAPHVASMIAINHLQAKEYDQLIDISLQLKAIHPKQPDGYLLAGMGYIFKRQFDQAKKVLDSLLEIVPGEPQASYNLANIAMQSNDNKLARVYLEKALKRNPLNFKLAKGLLKLEKIEGNYLEAEKLITKTIQHYPDSFEPIVLMTELYKTEKEYSKIITLVEPVWGKFSKNEQLLEALSWAYMGANQNAKARDLVQNFLTGSPASVNGYLVMALLFEKENKFEDSMDYIKKARKLDAENVPAQFFQARVLMRKGQNEPAKSILEKIVLLNPLDPEINKLLANIALRENQPSVAVSLLEKVIKQRGSNFLVVQLAIAHVRNKETKKAYSLLNDWLKEQPSDIFTLNALADLAIENDQWDMALKQYKAVLDLQTDKSVPLNNIAYILLQKGEKQQAMEKIKTAYQLDQKNPDILDTMASIHLALNENEKAVNLFKKAMLLKPKDLNIKLNFAKALIQSGQVEQGKKVLNNILLSHADFAKALNVQALLKELE